MSRILISLVIFSSTLFFCGFFSQKDFPNDEGTKELNSATTQKDTLNKNDQPNFSNYVNQTVPNYINRDNTPSNNQLNDTIATLGRVLFYDKKLSANNTISCASCHKQEFAFGDTATVSQGVFQELTERHSMRLVNIRYGEIKTFFWDERAKSLEHQTTQPIKDHIEMGFSGTKGDPTFEDLLKKLENINYYQDLFSSAFGDNQITETNIQFALAQFIRSIQSFDSKYDVGRAQVNNDIVPFPNFTKQENEGKRLFMLPKNENGANCHNCHRAPIFDIDPGVSNNGIISVAGDPTAFDLTNTKSPSLRDMVNRNEQLNGPLMHDGSLTSLAAVIDHYNKIPIDPRNRTRLNSRLRNADRTKGQNLQLTQAEKDALVAFLKTLTGSAIYTDERWSNPFDINDKLILK